MISGERYENSVREPNHDPCSRPRLLPGVTRTRVLELVVALGKDAQEFFAPVAVLSLLLEPVL